MRSPRTRFQLLETYFKSADDVKASVSKCAILGPMKVDFSTAGRIVSGQSGSEEGDVAAIIISALQGSN